MTLDPQSLPQLNDHEFKDLTKGRRLVAVSAYQSRTGCTFEEAQAVADYWYGLGFPIDPSAKKAANALSASLEPLRDPSAFGWICEACNGPLELLGVLGAREHARCRLCGLDHNRPVAVDGEDVGPSEADSLDLGQDAILTRPGESLIDTVQAAREADEEAFANDMKPRG